MATVGKNILDNLTTGNKENTDLLNDKKVRDYLSFVVPVPYKNTFVLRNQVYSYAKSIDYSIDEYCVRVNGSQIFKEYTTKLKEQSGASLKNYDEISRLEFRRSPLFKLLHSVKRRNLVTGRIYPPII